MVAKSALFESEVGDKWSFTLLYMAKLPHTVLVGPVVELMTHL